MQANIENWTVIDGYDNYEVSSLGRVRNAKTGRILALAPCKKGYLCVSLSQDNKKRTLRVHRLVATAFIPNPDNKDNIDHRDTDKQNNRVTNLRWCTTAENNRNRSMSSTKALRVKGVYKQGGRYRAKISHNGRGVHIGYYDTPEDAHRAYSEKATELYGEFARLE